MPLATSPYYAFYFFEGRAMSHIRPLLVVVMPVATQLLDTRLARHLTVLPQASTINGGAQDEGTQELPGLYLPGNLSVTDLECAVYVLQVVHHSIAYEFVESYRASQGICRLGTAQWTELLAFVAKWMPFALRVHQMPDS